MALSYGERLNDAPTLRIDGIEYLLADGPDAHTRELVPTQPGSDDEEFEQRIENYGLGWGQSQYVGRGGYDYANVANLHRPGVFLPGTAVTQLSPATAPTGPVSFCEYWDGVAANRRLIIVASRHVYEVDNAGTLSTNTLTTPVPSTARMGKGVRFKCPSMASPKIFIPVQNGGASDGFIVRSAANTYAEQAGPLIARAFGVGKDLEGEDVLWRIDGNGKLNSSVPDTDPATTANWAAAVYAVGETSSRVNDLFQQGRQLLAGKEDGAWTFDNVLNAVPVTKGIEHTPDPDNFTYFKDANGIAVVPTAQGLIWIDGLEWGTCGPVSSQQAARNLRGVEQAVSNQAGAYIYASVYFGGTSYIFLGTPKKQGDTGDGPFTWHGPVASLAFQVTDLHVSTVWGVKLWIGCDSKIAWMALNDDFSPVPDLASGNIFLPEGILDMDGPGIIKDFRKAEFVTRAAAPFSATNQWTFAVETTPGSGTYVAIDGGTVSSGASASRFWTTETSGKRLRCRLQYSGNTGSGELEAVIIRGTMRPEKAAMHTFRVRMEDGARTGTGKRLHRTARGDANTLLALPTAGRKVAIVHGNTTVTGRVTSVAEQTERKSNDMAPTRIFEVRVREVALV